MTTHAHITASSSKAAMNCQSFALTEQARFKVRHIVLPPGGRIGPMAHLHKAKHVVVAKGCAALSRGNDRKLLFEAQAVDIAIGTEHVIENQGRVELHLIEVLTGAYLGDDDDVAGPLAA